MNRQELNKYFDIAIIGGLVCIGTLFFGVMLFGFETKILAIILMLAGGEAALIGTLLQNTVKISKEVKK